METSATFFISDTSDRISTKLVLYWKLTGKCNSDLYRFNITQPLLEPHIELQKCFSSTRRHKQGLDSLSEIQIALRATGSG
jgi:hypothetical protein